jgi:hypothetical protein
MGEYSLPAQGELGTAEDVIRQKTIQLNAAFRLDFNAVEWCIGGWHAGRHRLSQ